MQTFNSSEFYFAQTNSSFKSKPKIAFLNKKFFAHRVGNGPQYQYEQS